MSKDYKEQYVNDDDILKCAEYSVTKGFVLPADPDKVRCRFIEFKRLLRKREFTFRELETDLIRRYGVVEKIPLPEEDLPISNKVTITDACFGFLMLTGCMVLGWGLLKLIQKIFAYLGSIC